MGGDHKCPVCEATFTRPQHVARHMRSHTGDRPYKCQHCGDQFARSDLLSRHINKCHPNEKPLPAGNYRRKGTASATRATTSKQACDQCVQASLPCDGANPCVKCVQRKNRCTFVKFHRQTAPIGPGHGPQSQPRPVYAQPEDYPLPHALPTLTEGVYTSGFPYTQSYTTEQIPDAQDMAGFHPQQAQYMRRGSIDPSWLPYEQQQQPYSAVDDGSGTSQFNYNYAMAQPPDYRSLHNRRPSTEYGGSDGSSTHEHSVPSSTSSSNIHLPLTAHGSDVMMQAYRDVPYQQHVVPSQNAEGGFSSAFGQLSIEDPAVLAGLAPDGQPFFSSENVYSSPHPPHSAGPVAKDFQYPVAYERPSTSGGIPRSVMFPTALSGNDPLNHSHPAAPPSRESETRELKEFWKTYLRTPFSGSSPHSTPREQHQRQLGHEYPPGYKRQRVNSLPSVRSPGPSVIDQNPPSRNSDETPVNRTLHNPEDLRSYEAAVLARRAAPINLSLPSTKRPAAPSHPRSVPHPSSPYSHHPPPHAISPGLPGSSSLAHAFNAVHQHSPSPVSAGQCVSPTSSRESSVGLTASMDLDPRSNEHMQNYLYSVRPPYKRMASQTLEPDYSKRAATMNDRVVGRPRGGASENLDYSSSSASGSPDAPGSVGSD